MSATSEPDLSTRESTLQLLDAASDAGDRKDQYNQQWLTQVANVHATLAQADAIDRLTAALERMEFPALVVKREITGGRYVIRVKR